MADRQAITTDCWILAAPSPALYSSRRRRHSSKILRRSKWSPRPQARARRADLIRHLRHLAGELGLREMTGRGRFRAWGVV
ncbi:helix-turn-helix domain-containing protein [Mesorhizobium sp. M1409]|uniref:helix-turn-helix domain-containing protein n=1 Tax=unclassified Mesorhizobium TaxID=325217 RepID=UPI00333B354D